MKRSVVARLRAVVLHVSCHELPVLAVPSMRVATVGTSSVAVSKLVVASRTSLEGGEATPVRAHLSVRRTECATRLRIDRFHGWCLPRAVGLREEAEGSSRARSWRGSNSAPLPREVPTNVHPVRAG